MNFPGFKYKQNLSVDIEALVHLIAAHQRPDGEIPWCAGQKTDPWDHVESAMGLAIGGLFGAARKALRWLAANQLADGSWYAAYLEGRPQDKTRDSNLTAYIAVGLYHYHCVTGDAEFVAAMWPTMARAIEGINRKLYMGGTEHIRVFDCKFTRPLVLPAKVGLYVKDGEVYVGDAPGGPAYLVGNYETKGAEK